MKYKRIYIYIYIYIYIHNIMDQVSTYGYERDVEWHSAIPVYVDEC
jgi:hypothetical protein